MLQYLFFLMVILIVSSIEWSYLKVTLMVRISYDLQLFDNDDAKIRLLSENKPQTQEKTLSLQHF